jgi:hypothetical protein
MAKVDDETFNMSLAATIVAYWRDRGHAVDLRMASISVEGKGATYQLRSDMVDGRPRGAA